MLTALAREQFGPVYRTLTVVVVTTLRRWHRVRRQVKSHTTIRLRAAAEKCWDFENYSRDPARL